MKLEPITGRQFMDEQLPPAYRSHLPRALGAAYDAVDALMKDVPIFQTASARFGRGHLISWAVDFQIQSLLESGKWPFDYTWAWFDDPTGQYIKILLPSSVMTINQLADKTKRPRYAVFRSNQAVNNEPLLPYREIEEEIRIAGLPHLILGHGYKFLNFVQIGLPCPGEHEYGYIYRTPNILDQVHEVVSDRPPIEGADREPIVKLKEKLSKKIRDTK